MLTSKGYCDEHLHLSSNKHYDAHKRNQRSKAFYKSREWAQVRQQALIRDNFLCRHCLKNKKITKAEMVDHIIPVLVNWNKRLTLSNLQSLCNPCHNRKTAEDKRKYKG